MMACDEYQGFLVSRAVDAGQVPALCEQNALV